MNKYMVVLTFIEPLLGTVPKNKDVYAEHIATRAALEDDELAKELDTVEHLEEKGWTGFHANGNGPFIYDYVIKGFFKDACGMLRRSAETRSSKLKAYKKIVDGLVFVQPREIVLQLLEDLFVLERPLRAQTPQGDRVALARSDAAPAGTRVAFEIDILGGVSQPLLEEWLEYGVLRGLGQWRNASYGRFTYDLEEL